MNNNNCAYCVHFKSNLLSEDYCTLHDCETFGWFGCRNFENRK